ncbi:MAG: nucleotidyltransferase domain-containing protein [Ilumatobacteraceae bacterium]
MSFGPPVVIVEEFGSVERIEHIYLYGSWAARHARQAGPPLNDIDVLVVGQPDRDDIYDAAQRAQQRLAREVNVTLRTARAWSTADDGRSRQVKASPLLEVPYPASDGAVDRRK